MIEIKLKEVSNGFQVSIEGATHSGDYVYRAVDTLLMLEALGKLLYGRKVKVVED